MGQRLAAASGLKQKEDVRPRRQHSVLWSIEEEEVMGQHGSLPSYPCFRLSLPQQKFQLFRSVKEVSCQFLLLQCALSCDGIQHNQFMKEKLVLWLLM